MKGTRALSFLLALALLASLVIPGSFVLPAKADTDNGMRISKTATKNTDGTYTITLEAYATGSKVISEVTKDVPADIVLVLDQSGSMKDDMNTYSFRPYSGKTNSEFYDLRHNNGDKNLYFQLAGGGYAEVSVQRVSDLSYKPIENESNSYYYQNQNNLYVSYKGEYYNVTVDRDWKQNRIRYTYKFTVNGDTITILSDSAGSNTVPGFGDYGPLYLASSSYSYTYTYTDENGATQMIGTSDGADTKPTEFTLYERFVSDTTSRLAALKSAVTGFADSVAKKAMGADGVLGTGDDVDHRIAVVGFACSNTGNNDNYNNYQNTELFIGSTQYKYGTAAQGQYSNAFQNMKTTTGQSNVTASINALQADGATYVNHGLEIANGILNANPVPEGQKRSRIVIVFTDGVPGYSGYESGVASSAITQADTSRSNGANVYAVGIFEGADATSAGNSNGSDTQKANWFMQNLSDNKGTPQSPSYYLSASDSGTLSTIFQQISDQIESGGSSTSLTAETVIKDIVAPQFTLPTNATAADITLKTYNYIGENQWSENVGDTKGATATVDGDQVSVTGFNFSENWCGTETKDGETTYRGNKLVISFTVEVKDGFLGGNGVYTNTSAGVYENDNSETPVMTFEKPTVDIPIADVTVDPEAKNVYLLQDVSVDTLKSGATVTVGDVSLDLSKADENYGLAGWQTAYVDITVEVKDASGNVISSDLTGLTDDSTYSITVTVSPKKTEGAATAKSGTDSDSINVFKPVLTYKDSDVYYGATAPTDFSGNLASTSWQHDGAAADATTMGAAPALSFQYTPGTGVVNGTIATKQDIPVDVTVKIGTFDVTQYVNFEHQACTDRTETLPTGSEFLLHVKTCSLTITKTGGADDEPYVFTVNKDGAEYTEASITGNGSVTIYELPVGTYTIEEETGWSWRYAPSYSDSVTLDASNTSGTITCTNAQTKNFWLNGFSSVIANIFGVSR